MRRWYGASTGHLVLLVACLSVGGYALERMWQEGPIVELTVAFVGLIILHDLVGWPLYTWVDRQFQKFPGARRRGAVTRVSLINHLRVPAFISGTLLLVAGPLILRLSSTRYRSLAGVSENPYLWNWVAITAMLFVGSAVSYGLRIRCAGRVRPKAAVSASRTSTEEPHPHDRPGDEPPT